MSKAFIEIGEDGNFKFASSKGMGPDCEAFRKRLENALGTADESTHERTSDYNTKPEKTRVTERE